MFTKIILLTTVLVAVRATNVLVSSGVSTTSRQQDSDGNYAFAYDITDAEGASNSRSESGDSQGNVQGQYSIKDTDGRYRTVDYIADKGGYRAVVKTNEPGTAKTAPANLIIDSPYQAPVAPEVAEVAEVIPVEVIQPEPKPVTSTSSKFTIVHDVRPVKVVHTVPIAHPVVAHPVVAHPVVAHPVKVVRPDPVAHPAPVSKFSVFHARPVYAPMPFVFNRPGYFYPRLSFGNYKGSAF